MGASLSVFVVCCFLSEKGSPFSFFDQVLRTFRLSTFRPIAHIASWSNHSLWKPFVPYFCFDMPFAVVVGTAGPTPLRTVLICFRLWLEHLVQFVYRAVFVVTC